MLGVASLVGLVASPPVAADDASESPPEFSTAAPLARLELSIAPAGPVVAGSEQAAATTVTLTCTPDGGTHPTPKEACTSLRRVGGNFVLLPDVPDMYCPDVYDPHTVRATGYWSQSPSGPVRRVDYSETFGNRCQAAVGTDNVFRF